jgi:hypothetical protein
MSRLGQPAADALNRRAARRAVLLLAVVLTWVTPIAGQERAPNGRIYNELLPFVGLTGVRVEVVGLGGAIFNAPGVVGDPETVVTGLSRASQQQLDADIRADISEAFRAASIPLLASSASGTDVTPRLAIHIAWARVKADVVTVQVRIELLEAARLVKDPSQIGWSATWVNTYNSVSSGPDLTSVIRSVTRGQVTSFVELYVRAHRAA